MSNFRKCAMVAAVLGLLSLTGPAPAQPYFSPFPFADVMYGHHFYQKSGYVSVPPLAEPIRLGGTSTNLAVAQVPYRGSSSGIPGGYRGSVSGFPGGGGYSGSVFGLYNYYPVGGSYNYYGYGYSPVYGYYNPYWWSLYNLTGYGVSAYTAPLGSYAFPYSIAPSNYAPVYLQPGYYTSPLLYQP